MPKNKQWSGQRPIIKMEKQISPNLADLFELHPHFPMCGEELVQLGLPSDFQQKANFYPNRDYRRLMAIYTGECRKTRKGDWFLDQASGKASQCIVEGNSNNRYILKPLVVRLVVEAGPIDNVYKTPPEPPFTLEWFGIKDTNDKKEWHTLIDRTENPIEFQTMEAARAIAIQCMHINDCQNMLDVQVWWRIKDGADRTFEFKSQQS